MTDIPQLTDYEKACFDAIKQGARGARPGDLVLWRMLYDNGLPEPNPVAVIVQRIISSEGGHHVGWQPLAMIVGSDTVDRLSTVEGDTPEVLDPDGLEGPA